jgi:hypothetical protein
VRFRTGIVEREALGAAVGAAALAAIALWAAPPGTDLAAHVYQRLFYLQHGLVLWNNFWYAGRYSFVTYSLLYYPLAGVLGIKLLALASISTAALAFALLVLRQWGRDGRLSTRVFAVVWPGTVLSAAFPFALGAALALLALCEIQRGRRWRFGLLAALTLAASPLAFALLVVLATGAGLARRSPRRALLVPGAFLAAGGLIELVIYRVFPGGGRYPFHFVDLLLILAFCALAFAATWRVESARPLAGIFAVYAAVSVVVFAVPTDVGSNVSRLRYAAVPIAVLALALRGWRPLRTALPILCLAVAWNGTALATSLRRAQGEEVSEAQYWQPAVAFLHRNLSPSYRVEAVDTTAHWPAEYLPARGIPIVRGWYRQDDFPQNELLYDRFGPPAYRAWLRKLGVRYVVLAEAPADYSARAEAALLRSGRSGLVPVLRTSTVTVYSLPRPRPMVTGPAAARVERITPSSFMLRVAAPGTYRVAVRYSTYWLATPGCVRRSNDGMLLLTTPKAGSIDLDFRVGARRALETFAGVASSRCSD